ncbi:hypothetical protein FHT14_002949 [Xanthomonas arboricola]|nr:hypothetical protein [Xanthomonas arboricola]NJB79601.1 hypothetical protein [Xanthomonas arboricola]
MSCGGLKPLCLRVRRHRLRAIGARALKRPRRKRGPGRAVGIGVKVRRAKQSVSHF